MMSELLTVNNLAIAGLVYLAICVAAGLYVADIRGRPQWEGFVFPLLFGPVGLVVLACLPEEPKGDALEEPAEDVEVRGKLAVMARPPVLPVRPAPPRTPRRLLGEVDDR